jgi:hypothetical protein
MATKKKERGSLLGEGLMAQIGGILAATDVTEPLNEISETVPKEQTKPTDTQIKADKPLKTKTTPTSPKNAPGTATTTAAGQDKGESVEQAQGKQLEADSDKNPYEYMKRLKGELFPIDEPFFLPGPEGHEDADVTFTFRGPIYMKDTVEEHCHALKTKPSDWYRRAIKYLLYAEQQAMGKIE